MNVRGDYLWKPKEKVKVELALTTGRTLHGHIFVALGQRVLDVLNNASFCFLPFETFEGEFKIIAKSQIAEVTPIADRPARPVSLQDLAERGKDAELMAAHA